MTEIWIFTDLNENISYFEGNAEEAEKYMEEKLICSMCKEELKLGRSGKCDTDGMEYSISAFDTSCAAEYTIERNGESW